MSNETQKLSNARDVLEKRGLEVLAEYQLHGPAEDCLKGDGHLSIVLYHDEQDEQFIVHWFNRRDGSTFTGTYVGYDGTTGIDREEAEKQARQYFLQLVSERFLVWYGVHVDERERENIRALKRVIEQYKDLTERSANELQNLRDELDELRRAR